jgi:hypothetical protein
VEIRGGRHEIARARARMSGKRGEGGERPKTGPRARADPNPIYCTAEKAYNLYSILAFDLESDIRFISETIPLSGSQLDQQQCFTILAC